MKSFKTIFCLVLLFGSLQLKSTSFSGTVFTQYCNEEPMPAAGVEVAISFPGVGTLVQVTDANGNWGVSLLPEDPEGTYYIKVNSDLNPSPTFYSIKKGYPSNFNMDFIITPLNFEQPIVLFDCWNGNSVTLNSSEVNPFVNCSDGSSLLFATWNVTEEFGIDDPCTSTIDFPGCVRVFIYASDEEGNPEGLLSIDPVVSEMGCRPPCEDGSSVAVPIPQFFESGFYLLDFKFGCCDGESQIDMVSSFEELDSRRFLIHYGEGPLPADVDFDFLASFTVDGLNGNDPIDGIENTSGVQPGPELGPLTIGIDATITGGTFLETVTYTIEEVDCEGQGQGIVLFQTSFPAPQGSQPENFFFLDQFFADDGVTPYFFVDENTVGKCFKAIVTVSNSCNSTSKSSFFTITEACQFCMIGTDNNFEIANELVNSLGLTVDEPNSTKDVGNDLLSILPNPFEDQLSLQINIAKEGVQQWLITDAAGKILLSEQQYLQKGGQNILVNTEGWAKGIYFYQWENADQKFSGKIIKQ